jgi:hypothetical protein
MLDESSLNHLMARFTHSPTKKGWRHSKKRNSPVETGRNGATGGTGTESGSENGGNVADLCAGASVAASDAVRVRKTVGVLFGPRSSLPKTACNALRYRSSSFLN